MVVLVSGGAGYIGSHAVRALSAAGHTPVVIDNFSTGHREFVSGISCVEADVGDKAAVAHAVKQYGVEAAMHFASFINVGDSVHDPRSYYENNVASGIRFISALQEAGVKKFILSSTCAVYGSLGEIRPLSEKDAIQPINPYAACKRMLETVLTDFCAAYDFHTVVFRYFNASGAMENGDIGEWHEPETHLIPNILRSAKSADAAPLKVFGNDYPVPGGDGTAVRDYIHVTDLVAAHVLGLEYLLSHKGIHTFNLGTGHGASVLEVIRATESTLGQKIRYDIHPRRAGDAPYLVADSAHALQELGWQPKYSDLATILRTAAAWENKLETIRNRH